MNQKPIIPNYKIPDGHIVLKSHGGQCCGMSHVLTFPNTNPDQPATEIKAWTLEERASLVRANAAYYTHVIRVPSPEGTGRQRLKAVVDYACKMRPSGILEAVLADFQLGNWREPLEELGFREVNRHKNSNSQRMLHVFHLNTGAKS